VSDVISADLNDQNKNSGNTDIKLKEVPNAAQQSEKGQASQVRVRSLLNGVFLKTRLVRNQKANF
jgi:hypothetical protein